MPELLTQLRTLGWNTPWRLIASVLGVATMAAIVGSDDAVTKPSDAVQTAAGWAGTDVRLIAEVAAWINDPARVEAIGSAGLFLCAFSLLSLLTIVNPRQDHRAGSTFWLGAALTLQAGTYDAAKGWVVLLGFVTLVVIGVKVWSAAVGRRHDIDVTARTLCVLLSLLAGLIYAAAPLIWTLDDARPTAAALPDFDALWS